MSDPTETVHVLKSDFDLLQQAANAAMEDYLALTNLMGLENRDGLSPRQFMREVVLPLVGHLVHTQRQVDIASEDIRERASRFGNKTVEVNGVKGLMVGKKIPGLFDVPNREERRRRG